MNSTDEPVALLGAIPTLVTAVLGLLLAFGIDLTDEQVGAILGVVAALIVAVTAIQRSKVWPDAKVQQILDADSVIASAERR